MFQLFAGTPEDMGPGEIGAHAARAEAMGFDGLQVPDAIHDGLLYLPDYSGILHCIDAETGKTVWQHEVGPVWCASPTVADGRVFLGTERRDFWAFRTGREKEVLCKGRARSMPITMSVGDGAVYLPTQRRIFAVGIGDPGH